MATTNTTTKFIHEHVRMLGFPQIIVTRGWLYAWLRKCGWNVCERGFASLDYAAFGRDSTDEPLSDATWRDGLLAQVRDSYIRTDEDHLQMESL